MTIVPFLSGQAFDPETLQNLSVAFDDVCSRLRLERPSPASNVVAERIMMLAQRGVRDPGTLCETVLSELSLGQR